MALTIGQLMSVAGTAALQAANKPNYFFTPVMETPNAAGQYVFLVDRESGGRVPVVWTYRDDEINTSEQDKIALVRNLIGNAIDCMDDVLAERLNTDDDIEDVRFD